MKNKIAIYGAGGFGRETALMISQINNLYPSWELIGFFDDNKSKGNLVNEIPLLGGIDEVNSFATTLSVCIAIANPIHRSDIVQRITNSKINFPLLVHPQALLGCMKRNQFGKGTIITAGVILTTAITVGEFCILNVAATIGHDTVIKNFCTLMPACSISGNVMLGERSVVSTGARIIQGIELGSDCVVGAGAVVTKNFGSHGKLVGVPAQDKAARKV